MKKYGFILLLLAAVFPLSAQQLVYTNLANLLAQKADTVSTLMVEKRSLNNIYMSGGADYHISSANNKKFTKYIKNRVYAVQVDSALYVNCKFVHYNHYHFGNWFAPALRVRGRVYFAAQPYGQRASSRLDTGEVSQLSGVFGNAISASGLVNSRVFYVINPSTTRADFVSAESLLELLSDYPELQAQYKQEMSESAEVIGKYLQLLQTSP